MDERAPVSDRSTEAHWSWTAYGEVVCLTPGSPLLLRRLGRPGVVENRTVNGDPAAGRGQGVTDPRIIAEDPGPTKPGNKVEDNPLAIESPSTVESGDEPWWPYTGTKLETADTAKRPPTASAPHPARGPARTRRQRRRRVGSRGREASGTAWERPHRKAEGARETQRGKGEVREDADAGGPRPRRTRALPARHRPGLPGHLRRQTVTEEGT